MNKREQFIQKRAEGLSYEKISMEIGISKPTLIKWGKKEEEAIRKATNKIKKDFLKNIRRQADERKERLRNIMNAAYKSLAEINYEELSAGDLLNLIVRLESKLKEYLDFKEGDESYHVNIGRLGTSILNYKPKDTKQIRQDDGDRESRDGDISE